MRRFFIRPGQAAPRYVRRYQRLDKLAPRLEHISEATPDLHCRISEPQLKAHGRIVAPHALPHVNRSALPVRFRHLASVPRGNDRYALFLLAPPRMAGLCLLTDRKVADHQDCCHSWVTAYGPDSGSTADTTSWTWLSRESGLPAAGT